MSQGKGLLPDGKGSNALERIALYLHTNDELVLSGKDREIFARLTFLDNQIREFLYTPQEAVARLLARYPTISRATALNDLTDCRRLFGSTSVQNRAYNIELIDGIIMKAIRKAMDRGDMRSVAALTKNLIVLKGLDRPEVEEQTTNRQPRTIIFNFEPKQLNIEESKGNLNERIDRALGRKQEAEDADWEQL